MELPELAVRGGRLLLCIGDRLKRKPGLRGRTGENQGLHVGQNVVTMHRRSRTPVEVLDPDVADSRLHAVGGRVEAWNHDGLVTVAVRAPGGSAPRMLGTVTERLRPAGPGLWALRLRVPHVESACIEYRLVGEAGKVLDEGGVWRGPTAGPAAPAVCVGVAPAAVISSAVPGMAERHPVRLWCPERPSALMLCADGEGLEAWAALVAAASLPVALVGIASSGLQYSFAEDRPPYDAKEDPRACAYLPDVDPAYFAEHMRYAIDSVLPWARSHVGDLPALVFGTSNGAVFAASAAAAHPEVFSGSLVFSLGMRPARAVRGRRVPHALVAGRLEPGFCRETTRHARRLRRRGVPVRLERPVRGHDHSMWADELAPALHWVLDHLRPGAAPTKGGLPA